MSSVKDENSNFSARVLELAAKKDLSIILPYLDIFSNLLSRLLLDGSSRASAKIIEMLTVQYFIKMNSVYIGSLPDEFLERFTERCFDWMITNRAIAIQAHSMYALYLLGLKFDWIHPELITILEKDFNSHSAAFRARARQLLKKLKK